MTDAQRKSHYRRARIRNFLFTVGPNRLSGGRLGRRHLTGAIVRQEIEMWSTVWPAELDGLRIAHVSDFHVGELITLKRVAEAMDIVRDAEPDLVACTGDVIDLRTAPLREALRLIGAVEAPMGVALVAGNHDELECGHTFRRMARDEGLLMLDDEVAVLRRGPIELVVAGIGWGRSEKECAAKVAVTCDDGCHVLLAHNPKAFRAASRLGIPLVLSGHTHGGQVALPGRPNVNLAVGHRHSAGVFREAESQIHVTTGVGSWFPLRLNCPAEVAIITMRSDDAANDAGERTSGAC